VVTPATGSFAANQHRFDIDQGTITGTTSGLLAGDPINTAFTPENPASGTGNGNGSVVLVHTGDIGIYRNYTVTATMPVAINDSFVSGTNTVNVTGTGTVRASGTVQVPKTEYLAWTLDQGIPNAPFAGDPNGDGVSNGLLWALGLNFYENQFPQRVQAPRRILADLPRPVLALRPEVAPAALEHPFHEALAPDRHPVAEPAHPAKQQVRPRQLPAALQHRLHPLLRKPLLQPYRVLSRDSYRDRNRSNAEMDRDFTLRSAVKL
jgi:hypothetical protein